MSGNLNISTDNKNANYVLTKVEEARVGEGFSLPTLSKGGTAFSALPDGVIVLDGGVLKSLVA
jgi:hypothetical protein